MNGSGTLRLLQSELSFWHSSSIVIPIVEWALVDSVIGDTHLTSFPSIGSHMPASIIMSNAFEKYAARVVLMVSGLFSCSVGYLPGHVTGGWLLVYV